jgi:hypothetical protein
MNYKLSLVIERCVNANASPDWPKPLKQWGACGFPCIQSFVWSMAHAGLDSTRKTTHTGVLSLRERDNRKAQDKFTGVLSLRERDN